MNRRELLANSAGVMLASVVPQSAAWASSSYNNTPLKGWIENDLTVSLHGPIIKGLTPVVTKKSVHAISPAEWDVVSNHVISLGNVYGQLANHHYADDWVRVNQNQIKAKFGADPVNIILNRGWHYHYHQVGLSFNDVANKLRSPSPAGPPPPHVCELGVAAVAFDYMALAFAIDPITAPGAPAVALLGLGFGIAAIFLCD